VRRASFDFQIFVKPVGGACNLNCSYCYYREKDAGEAGVERMPLELAENYMRQHIAAAPGETISFSWHGGEPTILGLDYFRRIVELQRKHRPIGRRIFNGIQTNGLLLDEQWVQFFKAENFGVGLSVDGPADLHDCYRVSLGGAPSHSRVLRAYELLRRSGIAVDLLCVVHARNVQSPLRVYRFFREIGASYITFLPLVKRDASGRLDPASVPAPAWGDFLCSVFDEWLSRDRGRIMVQIFEEAARPLRGMEHSLCIFRETCGEIPVIEHNGDFYSCDHFVNPSHRIGNILETPLVDLLESPRQAAFGRAKRDLLPRQCRECEVLAMCHGACPKDRFLKSRDGEDGLNYLCEGYFKFFTYSRPYLRRLVEGTARTGAAPAGKTVRAGRNDPCPCGSGRKYKHCCLGR